MRALGGCGSFLMHSAALGKEQSFAANGLVLKLLFTLLELIWLVWLAVRGV